MNAGKRRFVKIDGEKNKRFMGYYSNLPDKTKIFVTHRKHFHWFRKYLGWGFNKFLVDELIKNNVKLVVLKYKSKEKKERVYITTPEEIKEHGIEYQAPEWFEPQYVLPKKYFEEIKE